MTFIHDSINEEPLKNAHVLAKTNKQTETIEWNLENKHLNSNSKLRGLFNKVCVRRLYGMYMETIEHCREKLKKTKLMGQIPCSWIGRLNIVKISPLFKLIYRSKKIPVKIPVGFWTIFIEFSRLNLYGNAKALE